MIIWRPCSSCGTTDYPKHHWKHTLKGGIATYYLSTKCILCHKENESTRHRKYRSNSENKKRIIKKQRQWRKNNPDYMKKAHKKYMVNNKDKISERGKIYYQKNKDKILCKQKKIRLLKRIKKWGDLTVREIHAKVNSRKKHPFREMEKTKCQKIMSLK